VKSDGGAVEASRRGGGIIGGTTATASTFAAASVGISDGTACVKWPKCRQRSALSHAFEAMALFEPDALSFAVPLLHFAVILRRSSSHSHEHGDLGEWGAPPRSESGVPSRSERAPSGCPWREK
jgi:hypothetical protein